MSADFTRLPSLVSLVLAVACANALAFTVFAIVRAAARRLGITHGSPAVGAWATAAGSLGALLFAFTIVTLWSIDRNTRAAVDAEAAAVRMVARDVRPDQIPLARAYLQSAIREWPALCEGGSFDNGTRALEVLMHQAVARNATFNDDLYRQLSSIETMRFQRVRSARSGIPRELWVGVVAMAVAMFAILSLMLLEHRGYHATLMAIYATVVGMLFWVAILLDFPFCGATAITPQPFIDALNLLT